MKKKSTKKGKTVMKVQIEENVAFDNLVNSYLSDFIFEGLNGSVTGQNDSVTNPNEFKKKKLEKATREIQKISTSDVKTALDAAKKAGLNVTV